MCGFFFHTGFQIEKIPKVQNNLRIALFKQEKSSETQCFRASEEKV